MVDNDDKYADDGENLTQVRSIIKHLNEDKPSTERSREVVVRADGSKVVRVTKKKRVMLTSADVRRRSRKQAIFVAAALMAVLVVCAAALFFRMTTMTGTAYVEKQKLALQQAWNASNVQIDGPGVAGTSLQINSIVAEFPESGMLERVELSGIHASLDLTSFLNGDFRGENVEIERAVVVLRNGANMQMPKYEGRDLWSFRRMDCKDFSVQFSDASQGPVQLKNSHAYMYYPAASRHSSVLIIRGGKLEIAGWRTVRIAEGKAHVSPTGIDDFSLSGTTDAETDVVESRRTTIAFAGQIAAGNPLNGPFSMESGNMSLADFTEGRFEEFLTARTVAVSHGKLSGKASILLSDKGGKPEFSGQFHLKDICLSSFPALMAIQEHIEPGKRRTYNPLLLHRGYVCLGREAGATFVEIPKDALAERDIASLSGKIILNEANELSGNLEYGIPAVLTRVEYPDGHPDPIFRESGEWSVLATRIKGLGNKPSDDMTEVEARAAIARRERPARIPFDKLDINQLTETMLNGSSAVQPAPGDEPQSEPAPRPAGQQPLPRAPQFMPGSPTLQNPFEESEDPFAPSSSVPF